MNVKPKIKDMKNEDYENGCFIMMPFSSCEGYDHNHFDRVYEQIIEPAIRDAGLIPFTTKNSLISIDIMSEILEYIKNCKYSICDLSSRNPNVLYELGLRHAYDMPVLLIKDEKTDKIFDVGGINTISYNSHRLFENVIDAKEKIKCGLVEIEKSSTILKSIKISKAVDANEPIAEKDKNEYLIGEIYKLLKMQNTNSFIRGDTRIGYSKKLDNISWENAYNQLNFQSNLDNYPVMMNNYGDYSFDDLRNESQMILQQLKENASDENRDNLLNRYNEINEIIQIRKSKL